MAIETARVRSLYFTPGNATAVSDAPDAQKTHPAAAYFSLDGGAMPFSRR